MRAAIPIVTQLYDNYQIEIAGFHRIRKKRSTDGNTHNTTVGLQLLTPSQQLPMWFWNAAGEVFEILCHHLGAVQRAASAVAIMDVLFYSSPFG